MTWRSEPRAFVLSPAREDETNREGETMCIIEQDAARGSLMDALAQFKEAQKQGWAHFAPLETLTTPQAPRLLKHARVRAGHRVLDVACGTGVVAITAARLGARVTGLDLTPALLERARENAGIAGVDVDWYEAVALPRRGFRCGPQPVRAPVRPEA